MKAEEAYQCGKCGLCLTSCPVYRVTREESITPRAKVHLIRSYVEARLPDTDRMQDKLQCCLMCGTCTAMCPGGRESRRPVHAHARGDGRQAWTIRGIPGHSRHPAQGKPPAHGHPGRPHRHQFAGSAHHRPHAHRQHPGGKLPGAQPHALPGPGPQNHRGQGDGGGHGGLFHRLRHQSHFRAHRPRRDPGAHAHGIPRRAARKAGLLRPAPLLPRQHRRRPAKT